MNEHHQVCRVSAPILRLLQQVRDEIMSRLPTPEIRGEYQHEQDWSRIVDGRNECWISVVDKNPRLQMR